LLGEPVMCTFYVIDREGTSIDGVEVTIFLQNSDLSQEKTVIEPCYDFKP